MVNVGGTTQKLQQYALQVQRQGAG